MSDEQRIAEIRARVDAAHPSVDFEMMADLVCGQSYRNLESEALAVAMRTCEVTPYTGCGKPMRWVYAYRCRQCGRWMHGPCIDRHFGLVGCPATRDGQAELTAENARLRERVAALEERTEAAEGRVLALADALADVVLLIHEKGHSGMPSRCERGVCVTGWQLVAAVRESAVDSLAADFAAALAGQETAGGAS